MAQKPNPAAASQSNTRDRVVREVWGMGASYSGLATNHQTELDNLGDDAFMEVTELGKWYQEADPLSADFSDEFNELFRLKWVAKALRFFMSREKAEAYEKQFVMPQEMKLTSLYSSNWLSTTTQVASDTWTTSTLRLAALAVLIRQRTPFYPPIPMVDREIRAEFVKMWNARNWSFRKRSAKLTFATSGNVTVDSSYVFDGMASQKFWIKGSNGARYEVNRLDAERFAERAAYYDGKTGRPLYFYDFDQGETKKIQLLPLPDQSYTGYALIYIGLPDFSSTATDSDTYSLLPQEFKHHLRDKVIARLFHISGREDNDTKRWMDRVEDEYQRLADNWDDKGHHTHNVSTQFARRWVETLASYPGTTGVIGQIE